MTTYPNWTAGDLITAKLLTAGQWNLIVKSANQDVVESTTFVDDTELVVPLEANASYVLIWCLALGATTNTGPHYCHVNTEFTWPSGATGFKFSQGPAYPGDAISDRQNTLMVSAVHGAATDRRYGTVSLTSTAAAVEHHQITTSSTAGNATFRFCLGNNPTGTGDTARCLAGSFVTWARVA